MTFFQVALGGAIGACLRHALVGSVGFPYGTLSVNVIGSFAMGIAFVLLWDKGWDRHLPLLMTGILGGFTTFSAFSLDTLRLFETGKYLGAFGYVAASVMLSLVAIFAAVTLMRAVLS